MKAALWQLTRQHYSWVVGFFDLTNAFPCVARPAVDAFIDQCADPHSPTLLKSRYHRALLIISYPGAGEETFDTICLKPGHGVLQGDVAAPQPFIGAFDDSAEKVWKDSQTLLEERALT
eukprot:9382521-Heterocapsa_arctica.AAC.1